MELGDFFYGTAHIYNIEMIFLTHIIIQVCESEQSDAEHEIQTYSVRGQ
jgi:hypothetical protein